MHRPYLDHKSTLPPAVAILCTALALLLVAFSGRLAAGQLDDTTKQQRVMAMYNDYRENFPEVQDIEAEKAISLLSHPKVVFVDVRQTREQAVSMIPGAITDKAFMDHRESYRGKRVIVYCTISYRSGKLAAKLQKQGFSIINLRAGLLGWVHADGPLVQGEKPVRQLHVYGRKWDLAPEGFKAVY